MQSPFQKQNPFIKPTCSEYRNIFPSKTFHSFAPKAKYSNKRHFISDAYIYQATILDRVFKERDHLNEFIQNQHLNLQESDCFKKIENDIFITKMYDADPAAKYIGNKDNPFFKKYLAIQPVVKPTEGYYSHAWQQHQAKSTLIGPRFMDPLLFKTGSQIQQEYNKTRKSLLMQRNNIENIFKKRKQQQQMQYALKVKETQRILKQQSKHLQTPITKVKIKKPREKSVKVVPIYQQQFQDDQKLQNQTQKKLTRTAQPIFDRKQNSLQKQVAKYLYKTAQPDKTNPINYGDTFGGNFVKKQQFEKTGSFRQIGQKRESAKRNGLPQKVQQTSILKTQHSVPEQYTNVNLSYSPAASEDNSVTLMNSKTVKKVQDDFDTEFIPQDPRKVMQDLMILMPEAAQQLRQSEKIRQKLKRKISQTSQSRKSYQSQKEQRGYPSPDIIFQNFGLVPLSQNYIRQQQDQDEQGQQDIPNVAFEAWNFQSKENEYPTVLFWRHKDYQLINN